MFKTIQILCIVLIASFILSACGEKEQQTSLAQPASAPVAALAPPPPEAPVPVEPVYLVSMSEPKIKYDGEKYQFVVHIQNISNTRIKGSICARMYDKDGFEVDTMSGDELNMALGASESSNGKKYLEPKIENQVTNIKMYFAKYRCLDSPSEAISYVANMKVR